MQTSQAYRPIRADAGKVSVLFQLMAVRRSAAVMIHQGKGAWLWGYCQFRQALGHTAGFMQEGEKNV